MTNQGHIYHAGTSLPHFRARFSQLAQEHKEVRWACLNGIYMVLDSNALNKLKEKFTR